MVGGATCNHNSPHSCHLQTDPAGRQHTGASISDIWMYFRYLKVFWTSVWFSGQVSGRTRIATGGASSVYLPSPLSVLAPQTSPLSLLSQWDSSMRSGQVAVRAALLTGFILLTLASTADWVPVQVSTTWKAQMCCNSRRKHKIYWTIKNREM